MLTGQCHCGNISFTTNKTPETLIECNCSICSRYATKWAHFKPDDVTVSVRNKPTQTYRWGDEFIDFHHCPTCGCVTHYTGTGKNSEEGFERLSVNTRMCPAEQTDGIRIRHFDGADTWQFLD